VNVGQLKFGASNFALSWPTTEQLDSGTVDDDTDEEQLEPDVVYVSDVTQELSDSVLLYLEDKRCWGGDVKDSSLLDDGTFKAKFTDMEGWWQSIYNNNYPCQINNS